MKKLLLAALAFLALVGFAACKNSNNDKVNPPWDKKTMTYTDSMASIKITDIKQVTDYQGKPAITVSFTLKNKTDKAYGVTQFTNALLAAYQNKDYLLGAIIDLNNDNMGNPVAAGESVNSSVSYSLTNDKDEVTLKFISSTTKKAVDAYKISLPVK